jgi:hypothetical protein
MEALAIEVVNLASALLEMATIIINYSPWAGMALLISPAVPAILRRRFGRAVLVASICIAMLMILSPNYMRIFLILWLALWVYSAWPKPRRPINNVPAV